MPGGIAVQPRRIGLRDPFPLSTGPSSLAVDEGRRGGHPADLGPVRIGPLASSPSTILPDGPQVQGVEMVKLEQCLGPFHQAEATEVEEAGGSLSLPRCGRRAMASPCGCEGMGIPVESNGREGEGNRAYASLVATGIRRGEPPATIGSIPGRFRRYEPADATPDHAASTGVSPEMAVDVIFSAERRGPARWRMVHSPTRRPADPPDRLEQADRHGIRQVQAASLRADREADRAGGPILDPRARGSPRLSGPKTRASPGRYRASE